LNAGAAIYVAGQSDTLEAGVRAAEEAIDTGLVSAKLDSLIAVSQEMVPT